MKKKLLLTFAFIQLFVAAKSQITFQMVYGDATHDEAKSVVQSGNGFFFLGSSINPGIDSSKIIYEKLDSTANIILSSTLYVNNLKNDYGNYIKETIDDALVICGATYGSNIDPVSDDILLIKTIDLFGNVAWANVYGGTGSDEAYSLALCPDSGYIVAGATVSGTGNKSGFVMKVDASGTPVWYNANTIQNNSRFNKGCSTTNGGFVATGSTLYGSSKDLFVVKYGSSGNVKWSKRSAATGNQEGNAVSGTSDGGCIIAGSNSSNGSVNATDLLVVKLDSSGGTTWSKTYNYLFEDVATDIVELSNGHFILSCYTNSTDTIAPVRSICFLELSSSGVPLNASYYGSNTFDNISNAIIPTNDGGFLLAGITYEYDNVNGDAVLIKTDASGNTHGCNIHPASFTATPIALNDSVGSVLNSTLPNYSNIAMNPGSFTTSFSPICFDQSVSERGHATAFNLYPNPVQRELTIRFDAVHSSATLNISDVYGRIILHRMINSGESSIELPGEIFKQGIYHVELQSEKGIAVRKFVKVN